MVEFLTREVAWLSRITAKILIRRLLYEKSYNVNLFVQPRLI